jgi:hypothetical protein
VAERNRDAAWLIAKIEAISERRASSPLPEPAEKPKRYQLSADIAHAQQLPSFECPAGTPRQEWDAAVAAVRAGSAPSTIAKGSDVPSDFSLRIMGLAP